MIIVVLFVALSGALLSAGDLKTREDVRVEKQARAIEKIEADLRSRHAGDETGNAPTESEVRQQYFRVRLPATVRLVE